MKHKLDVFEISTAERDSPNALISNISRCRHEQRQHNKDWEKETKTHGGVIISAAPESFL